jgi:penicillin-binding protein
VVESLNEVPDHIINAVLAVEDSDFYKHFGVDLMGTARAVKELVLNEPVQTGGSTITQQVARNTFLSLERTAPRKIKEILLAIRLERILSKEQILLAYLNMVPFGNGSSGYNVYGIQAAAEGIFDVKNLKDLHLAQAAYLAGLPKNPSEYSAYDGYGRFDEKGFQRAMERQKHVLYRMRVVGAITEDEYRKALEFDVRSTMAESRPKAYTTYPYLMIEAELKAAEIFLKMGNPNLDKRQVDRAEWNRLVNEAREQMLGKGYHIYTTIDKTIYDEMRKIASNPENFTPDHEEKGVEQVGAIMIDNRTGAILGMIEGRDFQLEQLNHATQMVRQPGSTMKPLAAYLPAIESGAIQPGSIIDDFPMVLADGSKGYHLPNNWNMRFMGLVTARYALNQSLNIPALYLFNEVVTIPRAWEFVQSLGITTLTESDYHARTGVIGGLEYGTTVEELTNAYSAIPSGGMFRDAYFIERIEDSNGNVIYQHEVEPVQVFSPETAFLITDMLKTVITQGTGTSIRSTFQHINEYQIAGKTGSTQNDYDMWFVGFTPDITVGVWTGYDQPATVEYRHGGQHRAKNIWSMIMDMAITERPELFPNKEFEQPKDVIRMTVSGINGKLPGERSAEIRPNVTDWFNRKYIPTETDNSVGVFPYVKYKGLNYLPNDQTPRDMIKEKLFFQRPFNMTEKLREIEGILEKTPPNARPKKQGRPMTVADFYPEDSAMTAPTEPLPEVPDDGPPQPPVNVRVNRESDVVRTILFDPSESPDVLGYRIYRSVDGEPFRLLEGKVVLHGEYAAFYENINPFSSYAWYLTAVDVHGHESQPSQIVTSQPEGSLFPFPPLDPNGDNGGQPADDMSGVPSAPQDVQVRLSIDREAAIVSWSANPSVESVIRYEIDYSEDNVTYRTIGTSNTVRFTWRSDTLAGWYRVRAINAFGESMPSEPAQFIGQ